MASFTKEERLSSRKALDELFAQKSSVQHESLRLIFKNANLEQKFPVKVVVVVPKRLFRKAHDRNRLKRRIREAYRQQKDHLYTQLQTTGLKLHVAILFSSKEELSYQSVFHQMETLFNKLMLKLRS